MGFKELLAYQKAFQLAMEIFELSNHFLPKKNTLLLTKYVVHPGAYLLIFPNHIEKEDM